MLIESPQNISKRDIIRRKQNYNVNAKVIYEVI